MAAKVGAAALTTCIVQTLNESDPTFEKRFLANLEKAYREFSDGDRYGTREVIAALEMFAWTRELGLEHGDRTRQTIVEIEPTIASTH